MLRSIRTLARGEAQPCHAQALASVPFWCPPIDHAHGRSRLNSVRGLQEIVANIRLNNDVPIAEDKVMGFESLEAANVWLLANPQRTAAGVHFAVTSPTNIDFTLQANTTTKTFRGTTDDPLELVALPLQVATHREIVRCVL